MIEQWWLIGYERTEGRRVLRGNIAFKGSLADWLCDNPESIMTFAVAISQAEYAKLEANVA